MTSHDVVKAIRHHWLLVLAATILGAFVASVYAFAATPQYLAATKIFVAAQPPVSPAVAYADSQFASSRMASYVDLVTSQALATRTVERLHLDVAPGDLARKVAASVNPGSVIVNLSVTDSSPAAAKDLANALSEDFLAMVQEVDSATADGENAARATIIQRADYSRWMSPDRRLVVPLGTAVGLLIGIAIALIRPTPVRREPSHHVANEAATA